MEAGTMNERAEHRWSERQPLNLSVTLKANGQRPQQAWCRNLGFGGMYVETDPAGLTLNSQLYVGLALARGGKESCHRLPMRVVRLSQNGAGLMFNAFRPEVAHALKELLCRRSARAHVSCFPR